MTIAAAAATKQKDITPSAKQRAQFLKQLV
jgi:hypothetical protein